MRRDLRHDLTRGLRAPAVLAVAALALGAGCAGHSGSDSSQALAEDGTDASELESGSASLAAAFSLPTTTPTDLNGTLDAAPKTRAFFLPLGCLTTTVDTKAATVVHKFDDCTGPWGLAHVTGTVTVVYSTGVENGAPLLKLDLRGDALKLRRATVSLHDTATLVATGASREMTFTSDAQGTTARGRTFQRKGSRDVKWTVGDACLLANGTTEGDVAGRSLITTLTNYQRCRGECPAAGGKIDVRNADTGDEISLEFNGGTHATFTNASGATTDVTLACAL